MGFQSALNKTLTTAAIASELASKEGDKKVALATEGANLAEQEVALEAKTAEATDALKKSEDIYKKTLPDVNGRYRDEKGKFMKGDEGLKRNVEAAKEVEMRRKALSALQLKQKAHSMQTEDWMKRARWYGGIR